MTTKLVYITRQVNNIVYYINEVVYAKADRLETDLDLLHYSDYVVDVRNNVFLKARCDVTDLLGRAFDVHNEQELVTPEALRQFKKQLFAVLRANDVATNRDQNNDPFGDIK